MLFVTGVWPVAVLAVKLIGEKGQYSFQHLPEVMEAIAQVFRYMGFYRVEKEVWLSSLSGIKLPSGMEILSFYGGEQAVRAMLQSWGLSKEVVDEVVAALATSAPRDRRMDFIITAVDAFGRQYFFLSSTRAETT